MNTRPKLEVAGWIATLLSLALALVAYIWPRGPSEEPKPIADIPPQINQPGSTGTMGKGSVTTLSADGRYELPQRRLDASEGERSTPSSSPPPTSSDSAPPSGDGRSPEGASTLTSPSARSLLATTAGACLSPTTVPDGQRSRHYLRRSYCSDLKLGLQRMIGCEIQELVVEPVERASTIRHYGLAEEFTEQTVKISYTTSGDCTTEGPQVVIATRRRFDQLHKTVYDQQEPRSTFALTTTFGP